MTSPAARSNLEACACGYDAMAETAERLVRSRELLRR